MSKFRAQNSKTGEMVYGDYDKELNQIITDEQIAIDVVPSSVAKFIGYDSVSNSVYEYDRLLDSNGYEWLACSSDNVINGTGYSLPYKQL